MRVIAFNGSPHRDVNTSTLFGLVIEELENNGIETEYLAIVIVMIMILIYIPVQQRSVTV